MKTLLSSQTGLNLRVHLLNTNRLKHGRFIIHSIQSYIMFHESLQRINNQSFTFFKLLQMKKLLAYITIIFFFHILVWMTYVITGFNFQPSNVFSSSVFMQFTFTYWFICLLFLPSIIDVVDVSFSKKNIDNQKHSP
jgi:hypothetical protein